MESKVFDLSDLAYQKISSISDKFQEVGNFPQLKSITRKLDSIHSGLK